MGGVLWSEFFQPAAPNPGTRHTVRQIGAGPVPVSIPQGAYGPDFIAKLKALGLNLTEIPAADAATRRGTLAAVAIDPKTGRRTAVNQPGVMVYNSTD